MARCPACGGDYEASFCPRDGTRLLQSTIPVIGERYRLLRKVGEGAMGEVFEAEHVHLERRVAVKLLQRKIAGDKDVMARFKREAQSTTGLGHPNIVDTIDFGFAADGQPFLVMEWLDGENLDQRLDRGPIDATTALDIAAQACAGLSQAHGRDVVHRDLKPANLFLTKDHRATLLVKVLDFGIAKLRLHETKLTATGVLIGTPNYMAPEQAEGNPIDARTDIYALGVILYEMLTGTVPFHGDTPLSVLHQHTSKLPILPSARAPERHISEELDSLVMRCLAKSPDERFESMHALAAAIAAVQQAHPASVETPPKAHSAAIPVPRIPPPTMEAHRSLADSGTSGADLIPARGPRWILPLFGLVGLGVGIYLFATQRSHSGPADAGVGRATARDAASPPDAVVAVLTPDASVVPPSVDAGEPTSVVYSLDGHAFKGTVTVRPALPVAGQPSEITVQLTGLDDKAQKAVEAGRLKVSFELRYFKDHSLIEESTHALDNSLRLTTNPVLRHVGKHHLHVELLIDRKEIDHAKVDLFPQLR